MTSLPVTNAKAAYQHLLSVELGDVVVLPDGRHLTLRAAERRLQRPVGSMSGFLLGGEVGPSAVLVSIPSSPDQPVGLYTPLDYIPPHGRDASVACEGVVSYWSPHLPNISGAMGELGYKVCAIRGQIDPMVIIWRAKERVVFIRSAVASLGDLRFKCLTRDPSATERSHAREAARVVDPSLGTPTPSRPAYEQAPSRVRERIRQLVGR